MVPVRIPLDLWMVRFFDCITYRQEQKTKSGRVFCSCVNTDVRNKLMFH